MDLFDAVRHCCTECFGDSDTCPTTRASFHPLSIGEPSGPDIRVRAPHFSIRGLLRLVSHR